jgi:hypothetical protein
MTKPQIGITSKLWQDEPVHLLVQYREVSFPPSLSSRAMISVFSDHDSFLIAPCWTHSPCLWPLIGSNLGFVTRNPPSSSPIGEYPGPLPVPSTFFISHFISPSFRLASQAHKHTATNANKCAKLIHKNQPQLLLLVLHARNLRKPKLNPNHRCEVLLVPGQVTWHHVRIIFLLCHDRIHLQLNIDSPPK